MQKSASFSPAIPTSSEPAWRLITSAFDSGVSGIEALNGASNMAVDQVLLETAQSDARPTFRLYTWKPAALSLGRNQPTAGRFDSIRANQLGIDVVRRPTGGMAVWHNHEITYSVAAPISRIGSPRSAYRRINEGLLAGLQRLGVPAALHVTAPSTKSMQPVCFEAPQVGELIADGAKLVGSAQRREGSALLQHGSILLSGDQSMVGEAFGAATGPRTAITIESILGHVPDQFAMIDALASGIANTFGTELAPSTLSDTELERTRSVVHQYQSPEWTWRY